jgi:hypothetical protein
MKQAYSIRITRHIASCLERNIASRTYNLPHIMSSLVSRIKRSITLADLVTPLKDDLFPSQKDAIFCLQLTSPEFARLTSETLLISSICDDAHNARIAIEASHKLGIIDPATGRPCTSKIDRKMLASMPTISARKQRQIVCLLFFWEEEIVRWELLVEQEEEINMYERSRQVRSCTCSGRIRCEEALVTVCERSKWQVTARRTRGTSAGV